MNFEESHGPRATKKQKKEKTQVEKKENLTKLVVEKEDK